jgi:poly-gamma-glutamate capsule biosynthesis protein CapA/YwtB (metallophosphatase superfamily)
MVMASGRTMAGGDAAAPVRRPVTLFLCGDVMTGRGVDQILPHPGEPVLHEPIVGDARHYVALAEAANGPIARPVDFAYVWGDALAELARAAPDARIINLETSVTRSDDWEAKGINYRMHPANVACLTAARIDVCALANNHVLDYGRAGLLETLETLRRAGLRTAGAGHDLEEAWRPAVVELDRGGRVVVLAFGTQTSGIPAGWAAARDRPGVALLGDVSDATAAEVAARVRVVRRPRDVVVASIHWGSNWGYEVPRSHVRFAHRLIEDGVDVVHGHSSHHVRPLEVYEGKLILYGCGDFLNDYEGLTDHDELRADLTLMYLATVDAESGALARLRMVPMRIRNLRACRAGPADARWLRDTLARVSRRLGTRVELDGEALVLARPRRRRNGG